MITDMLERVIRYSHIISDIRIAIPGQYAMVRNLPMSLVVMVMR